MSTAALNNTLDNALNDTIRKLDIISISHPNLSAVWKSYLLKKYVDLLKDIHQCNHAFADDGGETGDMPLMSILLLMVDSQHSK
mgnify:CR=1 FL=1|tara:strand:- start:361 stop:612 length:252 start_codon:yes stop_codon:yes gene_type:complete